MRDPLPAEHYDAIVSVTALHHMPLDDALWRLSRALRPGGVLAAVALPRQNLARELPLTTREVRQHVTTTLPGAQVKRLIFWRYLLLWKRPVETHTADYRQPGA
jgi:SAM-dependent methyltransferase